MKRPRLTLKLSLHEARSLIALVEMGNEAPAADESQKRDGSRIVIRCTRLIHALGQPSEQA